MAAYGGSAELMNHVAPLGPVYQAGTLAGNPLAMCAGIATLKELRKPAVYEGVRAKSQMLVDGLRGAIDLSGVRAQVNATESLATIFFSDRTVKNYSDAKKSNTKRYARFFREMLGRGIFLAPSQFEAAFVGAAHTINDIKRTVAAAQDALKAITADSAA